MNISRLQIIRASILLAVLCALGCLLLLFVADNVVSSNASNTYSVASEVPAKKTALLLGTNKYAYSGRENLFYIYRINAVTTLYEAGKIEYVLVSGDNGTQSYNEPEQMKTDLVAAGIPESHIYLDYAGFRTWDSVIRANKVFLENDFIIVSQQFHNERALFSAKANDIDAIAFNAQDVPVARSPRIWLRERLARVKALIDATFNIQPRFLGEFIPIGDTISSKEQRQ